jgi:hypothetical protein
MLEVDIPIPAHINHDSIPAIVEQVCAQIGLNHISRGTLAKYPGCIHWHYKKDKARGTLEITWCPKGPRLWIKVAAGRTADWIPEAITNFKDQVEKYNSSRSSKSEGEAS